MKLTDLQEELELLRESTSQALQQAWDEIYHKEERLLDLERQLESYARREAGYKQIIRDLSQQARRVNCSGRTQTMKFGRSSSMSSSRSIRPSLVNTKGTSGRLDTFLQIKEKKLDPRSSAESVASAGPWSVGNDMRDFIQGKMGRIERERIEQDLTCKLEQLEDQLNTEVEEFEKKLESKETLIQNLEQSNRKHIKTILSLQRELETTKLVAAERVSTLELELKSGRQPTSRQVRDSGRYKIKVCELKSGFDLTGSKSQSPNRRPSPHRGSRSRESSSPIHGRRKTVTSFAA